MSQLDWCVVRVCEAVPFRLLRGHEWAAVEPGLPDTTVYDGEVTIGDYARYRWEAGKAHGPPCEACTWQQACEGPWKEYPAKYGWDEFVARTDPAFSPRERFGGVGWGGTAAGDLSGAARRPKALDPTPDRWHHDRRVTAGAAAEQVRQCADSDRDGRVAAPGFSG